MFRINRRTDYAIRVMLCLAKRSPGVRLATQEIQDEMLIPHAFLQRIIADLSKAGLINTYPGPNGGVQLAHPPESVNLRHIWEAIEGPLMISECLETSEDCPLESRCPVNPRWARLQNLIINELESSTLDELTRESYRPGSQAAIHKSDLYLQVHSTIG